MDWMIYGANGYTGELIAREVIRRGKTPILAGRNASKIAELASDVTLRNCRHGNSYLLVPSRGGDDIEPRLHGQFPEGSVRSC
jgi:uncharacterized protein YbjT (DUF2867 family)